MAVYQFHGSVTDVVREALEVWNDLSKNFPTPRCATCPSRDTFECTMRYLLIEIKLGAVFCVRAGRCRALLIFANSEYVTPWDWAHVVTDEGRKVDESSFDEFAQCLGLPGRNVSLKSMWASHYILCSIEQKNGCNPTPWKQYLPIMQTAAELVRLPDADIFINRRDCPVVRSDGKHAYAFSSPSCARPASNCKISPILSIYQGPGWCDLPVIEPDRPTRATGTRWERKKGVVFFRGAATGPGVCAQTNTRVAVVSALAGHDLADVGITSYPKRFKIENGTLHRPVSGGAIVERVPASSWSAWKYLLYIDGYSAALRYASMMSCNSVILKVDPIAPYADHAGDLWFFSKLCGVRYTSEQCLQGDVQNADHIMVEARLILECVHFLRNNDEVARSIAGRSVHIFTSEMNDTKRAEALANQIRASLSQLWELK